MAIPEEFKTTMPLGVKMRCPKCGNEKIATAKQPTLATYHYCAKCDYEWKDVTRLTLEKLKRDGINPTEANMI